MNPRSAAHYLISLGATAFAVRRRLSLAIVYENYPLAAPFTLCDRYR